MTLQQLTTHFAELPGWIAMGFACSELDFANTPYEMTIINNRDELLELFKKAVEAGKTSLEKASEEDLLPSWTLRHGETIFMTFTRYELIRHSLAQTIHHRAQLGVFLRKTFHYPKVTDQVPMNPAFNFRHSLHFNIKHHFA